MYDILYGDSLQQLKTLQDSSVDVLISDIPYSVNINKKWDDKLPSVDVWFECYRVLKPGSFCVIFGQPSKNLELMCVMNETSFEFRDMIIWKYQGTHSKGFKIETEEGLFRSRIRNVFNPIFIFRKQIEGTEKENWLKYKNNLFNIDVVREPYEGDHKNIVKKYKNTGKKHLQSNNPSNTYKNMGRKGWVPDERGREPTNIQYFPRASKKERTINGEINNKHETVKPINLMLWLVNLTTNNPDQVVLDPYCGTGSTGCACKLLNRKFIGIDNDKSSVETAKYRIENINKIKDLFF